MSINTPVLEDTVTGDSVSGQNIHYEDKRTLTQYGDENSNISNSLSTVKAII